MSTNCLQCQSPLIQGSKFCANCGFTYEADQTANSNIVTVILGALLSFTLSIAISFTGLYLILAGISFRYSTNHDNVFLIAAVTFAVYIIHVLFVPMMLSTWKHHNLKRGYNWGNIIFIVIGLIGIGAIYNAFF